MADKRISELNLHISPQLSDVIAIVNSGETKKTTYGTLYNTIRDGLVSGSSQIILDNVTNFNTYSSSVDSILTNLVNATSSYLTSETDSQTLSIVGDQLSISNGNTVTIPTGSDLPNGLVSGSSQITIGDTTGFTTFSGSIDTRLDNSLTTASLSSTVLTFEKGDNSTFDIDLSDTFITPSQTGSFIESAYISLYSTQSQQLVQSGSAQAVTFSNIWTQKGVSLVSGSQLVMETAGTYKFSFVAQLTNTQNAVHDSYFWIKYNGNNFPNSATQMSLQPRKNESTPSAQLMTVNIIGVAQNDNDYIELYWTGDSDTIQLNETPGDGVKPETPSVIANIIRVG